MTNPMQFPDGFVFGGATAAYQVEGETRTHGKGKAVSSPVAPARLTPRASPSITSFSPPATKLVLSPMSRSITSIRRRPSIRTAARDS